MNSVKQQISFLEDDSISINKRLGIAVLDSGIQDRHPDFSNQSIVFRDFVQHKEHAYDDYGHGTHICGIIAGNGKASNGKYAGLSKHALLVVGKILDRAGDGDYETLIQALQWVCDNAEKYNIRILNLSLSGIAAKSKENLQAVLELLDTLWDMGICVVCAAGNTGPGPGTVSEIGRGEKRICVGCYDLPGFVKRSRPCAAYSGRGCPMQNRKPDLVAPGTGIISCNAWFGRRGEPAYIAKSGTSMATAICSGVIACMMERYPGYSNEQLKTFLMETACDCQKEPWVQGSGMVNYKNILTLLG